MLRLIRRHFSIVADDWSIKLAHKGSVKHYLTYFLVSLCLLPGNLGTGDLHILQ